MKHRITFLFILLVAFVLVQTRCPHATINYVMLNRMSGETRWQIDNPILAKDIKIVDVKEVVENNLLYVNVLIKNSWYRPISGKMKLEFFDQNGIQLDNPWGWHPLLLESHQEEWFKFIAPRTERQITKMKIMIRGIGTYSTPEM